jgi:hypothetical protein
VRKNRLIIASEDQDMVCEWCGTHMKASQAYSILVVYAMPGHDSNAQVATQQHVPHQCPAEQHFADTPACARLLAIACILHLEQVHPESNNIKKSKRPESDQIEGILRSVHADLDLS